MATWCAHVRVHGVDHKACLPRRFSLCDSMLGRHTSGGMIVGFCRACAMSDRMLNVGRELCGAWVMPVLSGSAYSTGDAMRACSHAGHVAMDGHDGHDGHDVSDAGSDDTSVRRVGHQLSWVLCRRWCVEVACQGGYSVWSFMRVVSKWRWHVGPVSVTSLAGVVPVICIEPWHGLPVIIAVTAVITWGYVCVFFLARRVGSCE